ncbi:MAG: YncE family protein, partial [bacterium]
VLSVPGGSAIRVGQEPDGLAVSPDGKRVYVSNTLPDTLSVIDADEASATFHTVIATIGVGVFPIGIALTPDGTRAYVVAREDGNVAVIDTASLAVVPMRVAVRETPGRMALSPDGTRAYVANVLSRDVSLIDTAPLSPTFHTVLATIPVEGLPSSVVIGPPPPQTN